MKIWKFPLDVTELQGISIPSTARILTAQTQHEIPCIWAQVDENTALVTRKIRIAGTGHDIPENSKGIYIGTFQLRGGAFIYHVFDEGEE